MTHKGARCKRNTIKYLNRCHDHLRRELGLVVKRSTVSGAGNGLFTTVGRKRGNLITPYVGETKTESQQDKRYGIDATAPFSLEVSRNKIIDPSCQRGGAYANHMPASKANCRFAGNKSSGADIIAHKGIAAGSELFVNYGSSFRLSGVSHKTLPYDRSG